MPSPLPGMNPYLERPDLWAEVHHWLITLLARQLVPQVRPRYRVAIEHRIYETVDESAVLIGIPDITITQRAIDRLPTPTTDTTADTTTAIATLPAPQRVTLPMPQEVREGYLEVREVATGLVVTVIEILSPKNKRHGEGRRAYEAKRQNVLGSLAHLIEIDLLRAGDPMAVLSPTPATPYRIIVSRANRRPTADLYSFGLRDPIPAIPLPLRADEPEPLMDLQCLLHQMYDEAGLDLAMDYTQLLLPPLCDEDDEWVRSLLPSFDELTQ